MKIRNRFTLRQVASVTILCYLLLLILQFIGLTLTAGKHEAIHKMTSMETLQAGIAVYSFMTLYFYFFVNRFYSVITRKEAFLTSYLPLILLSVIIYTCYQSLALYLKPEAAKQLENLKAGLIAFSVVITSAMMTSLALVVAYLFSLRDEQQQRKQLEKQALELEKENAQANFNFLKAQINPHFLHNTLNFFYAKALPLSAELSEGILCLADIMRYALNEGGKEEKTLLEEEITHLRNLIKINQFRFSNNLNLELEVSGNTQGVLIVPFVLITIVENAFKHGDLQDSSSPITIRINVEGNHLAFYCHNKKRVGAKELTTGIGLKNIRKRLDIVYGGNYQYKIQEDNTHYTTQLTINPL